MRDPIPSKPGQFSLRGMFLILTGAAGGGALMHGMIADNPLAAILGLACLSCCVGVVAARVSAP